MSVSCEVVWVSWLVEAGLVVVWVSWVVVWPRSLRAFFRSCQIVFSFFSRGVSFLKLAASLANSSEIVVTVLAT
ncbi:hypothetical protein NRB20_65880 [Nocardia sp. RB20]|uniref:Uncharacterized protein n=1 Tax=Nocardia macrotermitis TaxID=2585198 RepID=A0A7K0DCR0_9NOCA|nr:hypothetical protein [Nocardia macrotermitis]